MAKHGAIESELVSQVAREFGEVRLKVTGASMLPRVWPRDILTVRRRDVAELAPGCIVLCYRDGEFVAHRLVGLRDGRVVTRGDALSSEDPPFRPEEVLGVVVGIERDGRQVSLARTWYHSAASWILRNSDLCTRLLLRLRR